MNALSYALRWLPLSLLAAVCVQDLGWWRTGAVLLVYLTVRQYWFLSLPMAVAGVMWLDIPYWYLFLAVVYRLVWDLRLKTVFARLVRARQRRESVRLPAVAPRLRCGHGLGERIEAADRLAGRGLADAATDAYLGILADHPVEPSCGRVLLLRTAEASRAAGDHMLAAELSAAALRGVPPDPTGRLATIAVRAHTTRAGALVGLGDLDEATRSLRRAQRLTQADRATERYVRWTAAEVRLAGRRIRTFDELNEQVAGAMVEQRLGLRETAVLHRLTIMAAWRLLEAGDGQGAERAFYSVRRLLDLGPARGIRGPDGRIRSIPAERQPAWRMFTLAVAGEVAAVAAKQEPLSSEDRTAADLATDLAWYFDENLTGARMLLTRALFDHGSGGDVQETVARLRRAQRFADLGLHTFADPRRQAEWVRLRQEIADGLRTVAGIVEPPVSSPWPVTPNGREQAMEARAKAEALFDRLAANDPEAFGPARRRLAPPPAAELDDDTSRALWGPPAEGMPAPAVHPPGRPGTKASGAPARPETAPKERPVGPPPPDPEWLEPLMSAAGGRCWTLPLALDLARALGHGHVGPEHLVLAVAHDGDCAEILAGLGVTTEALRAAVGCWYARTGKIATDLDPELTTLARDAASIAGALGEGRVRAAHLFMALLGNPQGAGGALLRAHGVDLEEVRVRSDAALAGPVLQARAGPLFTAGEIVHHHRLTLPAWLAIGHALDLAAAEPGRILGIRHLAEGVEAYGSRVLPRLEADGRGTVRVGLPARGILTAALAGADAAGEWGIELDHLSRAIGREEPSTEAPDRPSTRAACERAARLGRHFVTPEDVREASVLDGGGNLLLPVPVLTPAVRRARRAERSTA
ncbi:Clp protease N-terminal domain-containing protein [Micromonospora echinaurantiaca]|uniref:Clp protease N-terminal domain-containing protein n=1 Tax=Micromonospora echinaurantiaca TaxID=47857 RepID=UPI0037A1222E